MPIVRYKINPGEFPGLSPEDMARLDAMTPEEIEQNALDDPDNPPTTEEEFTRGLFGRRVRLARKALGLSQREFAEQFRINLRRLQDWEQGRVAPDSAMSAYVTLIEREPETVRRILEAAA